MKKHSIRKIWLLAAVLSMLLMLLGGCGNSATPSPSDTDKTTSEASTSIDDTTATEESTTTAAETTSSAKSESTAGTTKAAATTTKKQSTQTNKTTSSTSAKTTETASLDIDVYNLSNVQGKLGVWFFNMPHSTTHTGDSTLIRTPGGKTMLIDTGHPEGGKMVRGYLEKMGITKIDILVITHMHIDHVGGAYEIVSKFNIGKVYGSPLKDYNTSNVRNFKNALASKNLTYNVLKTGDTFELDKNVKFEALWPRADFNVPDGVTPENDGGFTNNSSVVLRMQYGSRTFLFTGDIEMEVEEELVNTMPEKLKCDVLKIPHHGASTSSTSAFIRATGAKYGAIMVYAMNDINVINRYKALGTKVHLTSVDGTALFLTDGQSLQYAKSK
mgnify:FL=1